MQFLQDRWRRLKASVASSLEEALADASSPPLADISSGDGAKEATPEIPLKFTGRRRFLHRLSVIMGGAATALIGLPFLGFLFVSRRAAPETTWRVIGTPADFPVGQTIKATFVDPAPLPWAGFSAQTAAWVRQQEDGTFVALSVYCTHVGCPIRWLEETRLFLCPCHGGSFYADGSIAGGPPRHPLARYQVRVREGQVEILAGPLPLPV
jgi:menaquinol-cytochrome c reductase iron-sulfur subunit